jgi:hypothetical protein
MPLREHGTVVVIDHVIKGATATTPYARGAGSKLADTEVMWYVDAVTPFSRSQIGELLLTKHKDREGVLPEHIRFEVGDGKGKLPIKRLADDASAASGAGAKIKAALLGTLTKHDGSELSTNQVLELTPGKRTAKLAALTELAADPSAPVSSRPGTNRTVVYRFDASAVTAEVI